ncbi:NUDIX hydrolase, partial [Micromonospora sp. KC721]|uniref:NUDIX domain-containing protein n=1 Tax=Micromonospora sp. KC721 TaxID=2530380 RepID=UPI001FB6A5DB
MSWTEPTTWYANLPAFHAAAAALITDAAGNVLLVKPTYRADWAFPGGYVEEDEYPHEACAREVREELGLAVAVGELLVVDWAPPAGQRRRALIHFTFDCGTIGLRNFDLPGHELEDAAFFSPQEAAQRLPGNVAPRVAAASAARARHAAVYLANGSPTLGGTAHHSDQGSIPGRSTERWVG